VQPEYKRYPSGVKEPLQINRQAGYYAKGDLGTDESTNWKMKWFPDILFLTRRLVWQEGDTVYLMELMWGGLVDKEEMHVVAESVK
jgi:hypothetical protein